MRGTYSTAGLLRFYEARNTLDSPAVLTVRHLGANPFCKTNVPQVDLFIFPHRSFYFRLFPRKITTLSTDIVSNGGSFHHGSF
jgi:hypothetical protein